MFSQRNNPYCELLQISMANIQKKKQCTSGFSIFFVRFVVNIKISITMKRILGLDLGTNSIGWAIINKFIDKEGNESLCGIESAGSRIIPMDATILGDFAKGNKVSQTQNRTKARSTRRMYERGHLRRERLHRVLAIMGYLPVDYLSQLDRYGKFLPNREPKLAWYMWRRS